ncbi:hypothetical protein [uncultured Helicobacter sp.]|uniref:hypothetical protein n=1 Tax=uncultured Helicobacter sp. TaxID=175537 RepID=UPI0026062B9A|nr:hypothetical protein [uncultured Helicobacter sp.]
MKKVVLGILFVTSLGTASLFANCSWTNSCQTNNQSIYQAAACKFFGLCNGR